MSIKKFYVGYPSGDQLEVLTKKAEYTDQWEVELDEKLVERYRRACLEAERIGDMIQRRINKQLGPPTRGIGWLGVGSCA